jgi:hypothetical protein
MRAITLYAIFPGDEAGYRVMEQLVERQYTTNLMRSTRGELVLVVTTVSLLRAEVEGLVWLGGGTMARRRVPELVRRGVSIDRMSDDEVGRDHRPRARRRDAGREANS